MASGDTLAVLLPWGNEPPTSNPATPDLRNGHPVLDFDPDTDEYGRWTSVLPRNYDSGGITVYINFAMSTATANEVRWQAAFERIGTGQQNLDSNGFAAAQSSSATTVPGTAGLTGVSTIAFTDGSQMDSIAVGETFRIVINRDADHVDDDATGDAEIVSVELKET